VVVIVIILVIGAIILLTPSRPPQKIPYAEIKFTYMSPVSSSAREFYSTMVVNSFQDFGIGIKEHYLTDFTSMSQRAWAYEDTNGNNYPIPIFDEGGFDVLSVGLSASIEYDPTCTFHTYYVNPYCLNMFDFGNETTDTIIDAYTSTMDFNKQDEHAKQFQKILRDELPTLSIYFTVNLHAVREEMNWDTKDALWKAIGADGLGWANITGGADTEFSWGHLYGLNEVDPITATQYMSVRAMSGIFPGLFNRNPETMRMEPALAVEPIEWNGLEATVKLRNNVKFSTGEAMDAYDVKNSWDWLLTDETGTQQKAWITAYISSKDSIVVLDDHTIKFIFDNLYLEPESFLNTAAIMPDEIIGPPDSPLIADYDFTVDPVNSVIGTGPFKYSEVDPTAKEIRLTAVQNWWGGEIKAESIYFPHYATKDAALVAIKAGDVDYIDNNYVVQVGEVAGSNGVEGIEGVMSGGVQMVSLNLNHPVFGTGVDTPLGKSDPTRAAEAARFVRQAMNYLVPREQIVTDILKGLGVPAVSNWPQLSPHYDENQTVVEYSFEKAEELLKKAGYNNASFTTSPSPYDYNFDFNYFWDLYSFGNNLLLAPTFVTIFIIVGIQIYRKFTRKFEKSKKIPLAIQEQESDNWNQPNHNIVTLRNCGSCNTKSDLTDQFCTNCGVWLDQ
jgi:ABC-type transport system substrate-binding protein